MLNHLWTGAWQGSLLFGLVWLATRRIKSAQTKSWLWWLVCLKFLVAPIVLIAPLVLPILPTLSDKPAYQAALQPVVKGKQTAIRIIRFPPIDLTPAPQDSPIPLATLLWGAGVLVCFGKIGRDRLVLRRWIREGVAIDEPKATEMGTILGIHKAPQMILTPKVGSPMLTGLWNPTILLPQKFNEEFTEDEKQLAIAHELSHVAHRDLFLAIVPELGCAAFFFVPFVWLARQAWRAEREVLCDQSAISAIGCSPRLYASLLLKLVDRFPRVRSSAALGATPRFGELKMRMTRLDQIPRRNLAVASTIICAVALLVLPWKVGAQSKSYTGEGYKQARIVTLSHAKMLGLGQMMYVNDYDDKLPIVRSTAQDAKLILPYLRSQIGVSYAQIKQKMAATDAEVAKLWTSLNPDGKRLLFNTHLSGLNLNQIPNPAETVMIYDDQPWPDGTRVVAYVDGHAKRVTAEQFKAGLTQAIRH